MKIGKNKVVEISYKLETDGKTIDQSPEGKPLDYIQGTGMLIPGLEKELEGMEAGDEYDIIVAPEDAYGAYNPKLKFNIPISSFEVDGKIRYDLLEIGKTIPLLNSAGNVVQATVVGVSGDEVCMDFNHRLAGKDLHFTGKIISVRDASAKELEEGLHGEFLPHKCHCHDGKGNNGCCHSEENGDGCGCGHHSEENGDGCGCGHHGEEGHECSCGHHDGEGHECCGRHDS